MPLSLLVGSVARPFGHSGALHTGGAVSLMCGSVRRLGARPGPAALQSCFVNFACNSLFAISKFEFMSLELQRFWALLKVHSIELHAKFGEGHVVGVRWGVGARNCSPCSSCWWRKRYKVLPACEKWAEIGVLGLAGRVLYRVGLPRPLAGRVLYRVGRRARRAGRVLYRVWSSEVVQDEFRFLTHLEEIRRWSSRMRRGTLG